MVTLEDLRRQVFVLPETSERPCYATPGFYVAGKLFARLREDGTSLALKVAELEREALCQLAPEVFSVPPHYQNSDMLVVELPKVEAEELQRLLAAAWGLRAPKRLLTAMRTGSP